MWQLLALMAGAPLLGAGIDELMKRYVTGEYDLERLKMEIARSQQHSEGIAKGKMAAAVHSRAVSDRAFGGTQESLMRGFLADQDPGAVASRQLATSGKSTDMDSIVASMAQKIGLSPQDVSKLPSASSFSPRQIALGLA